MSRFPRLLRALRKVPARVGAASCVPALLLAACGGGGGGGEAPPPAPSVSPVTITSQNQKALAADALQSTTDFSFALLGTELIAAAAQATGPGDTLAQRLPSVRKSASPRAEVVQGGPLPALAALRASTIGDPGAAQPCTYGGTMDITGHVAVSNQLAVGDTLTITANNCVEVVDNTRMTVNGILTSSVVDGSYNGASVVYPVHLVLALAARNFSVALPTVTALADGDQQVDIRLASATSSSIVLTGTAMTNVVTTGSGTHTSTLRNYRDAATFEGTQAMYEITARVETENRWLGNVFYDLSTPAPLTGSDAYTGGSLKLVGNSSALLVTVTGSDAFSLRLDANGDGTYESDTPTTVTELENYL